MKKLLFLPAIAVPLFIISCGPNAEQKAAMQKHHDDSVAEASKPLTAQQQVADTVLLKTYQTQLDARNGDLDEANKELATAKEPHADRTQAEENAELANKNVEIKKIQSDITDLQNKITALKARMGVGAATGK